MQQYVMRCRRCGSTRLVKSGWKGDKQRWECNDCGLRSISHIRSEDIEIVTEAVRLAKQKQRHQDTNRIERKSFRDSVRLDTALEEIYTEFITLLKDEKFQISTVKHKSLNSEVKLIIQISDTHFNELIDLPANKYSIDIAKSRLNAFVDKIFTYGSLYLCDTVIIAFTGDQVNSDRRTDEMLSMCKPRAKAMFDAVDCFTDVILRLNERFNVEVAMVTGNESRLDKEMGYSKLAGYQNYDFIINETLRRIFEGNKGIYFHPTDDPMEYVISVNGKNILMMHDCPKIKYTKAKYADNGILIDYIIYGHQHEAMICDTYARSGSLVGSNGYSEHHIQVAGRASQNLHVVYKDEFIDTIKVDLQ